MAPLQFQSFSPLLAWQGAWQRAGRHGAVEIAESLTSHRQLEVDWHTHQYPEHRKPTQSPPPQWHTSSNKAISYPTKPHLLLVPPTPDGIMGANYIQTTTHCSDLIVPYQKKIKLNKVPQCHVLTKQL